MVTTLQRINNLTATDPEKRQRFLVARKWALERVSYHVVHIDGDISLSCFLHVFRGGVGI